MTVTGPVSKQRGDRAAVVTFRSTVSRSAIGQRRNSTWLNASVKALSETIGLKLLMEETLNALRVVPVSLHVDASACKGMLLRHGSGRVKHLATKQLWAKGAIESYSVVACKIPRCQNAADIPTHSVSHAELVAGLRAMGFSLR